MGRATWSWGGISLVEARRLADHNRTTIVSRSPEHTRAIGKALGKCAEPGDVFLLAGGLGAGKTCLTQGVLWGLGGAEYARSPTFVLVSQYPARLTLHHVDLYRLDSFPDVEGLELDEYLYGDGLCVVEWADKAEGIFPESSLAIRLEIMGESTRRITFEPPRRRAEWLANALSGVLVWNFQ